jgi:hypothetical protein
LLLLIIEGQAAPKDIPARPRPLGTYLSSAHFRQR